ncbi:GNAT family N-acetyltransferase [Sorangium sp. So ce385]|uniref:GNAT family N-acetyltransferase n=1 Tax=Sorangium sp. So ce385 TaxID=3133308 RepID=UPI003F5BBB73
MRYQTRILCRRAELAELAAVWERCRHAQAQRQLQHRLEHIAIEAEEMARTRSSGGAGSGGAGEEGMMVAALFDLERGTLVGAAPFLLQEWTWRCRLGYLSVGAFPVRRAVLCGTDWLAPDAPAEQEALLQAFLSAEVPYQMIFIEGLPVASDLLRLLQSSPQVRREFWVDTLAGVTPRRLVDLPGSFEAYLAKFSGRTRRTLRYKVKRLRGAMTHGLRLQRVTRKEELPRFLEQAGIVAARSWQGRCLGQSVDEEAALRKLEAFAERGWLRGYLLLDGDAPVAFVIGLLDEGTYYYERVGYDPAWAAYQPGTVLLLMILEDLCADGVPRTLDFGYGDSEYKRLFSTRSYDELTVRLVRKSASMVVPYVTHAACWSGAALIRKGLDRFALREKVRRLLRGEPAPAAQVEAPSAAFDEAETAHPGGAARPGAAARPGEAARRGEAARSVHAPAP